MIPIEKIETINKRLLDHYGSTNNLPNFRIIFSEDQFENRLTNYTDEGFQLIHPEVRRLPKYKQWIQEKYILERLMEVPAINQNELQNILSYEPIWVFEDKEGLPLRPAWIAAKMVVDQIHQNMENKGIFTRYKDPDDGLKTKDQLEKKDHELKQLEEALFGDENDITDALAYGNGVAGFHSKMKEN